MSAAGLLAALAVLLGCAALRELLAVRGGMALPPLPFGLGRRSARAALRLGLPERLRRAGLEARLPLGAVLAAKLATTACGGIAALFAAPAAPGRTALLVAIGLPAAGFLVPDALLEREARRRQRRLLAALPDALDLLAVSAGSGRGPAAGLEQLARAGQGPLAEELRLTAAELSYGLPLSAALRSLRARVPGPELATLVATIERSRRFGSPLAEQLRRQAGALRRDGRRATEERAARAAPKIQLVVALVLVPSVLLMIAAALIANAETLLAGF
ncbi:MAG TPA: type II secretion system F family protein [Solirubrobacterales bacterium]|nr:type II secretion system F family protein [Solirubrobacterales bacterium]